MLSYLCLGQAARDWLDVGLIVSADSHQPLPLQPSTDQNRAELLLVDSSSLEPQAVADYHFSQLIEVDRYCPQTIQLPPQIPGCQKLLAFCLGTERAYRERIAPLFITCLRQRFPQLPTSAESLYDLPLHEAIINAAIHGNLELTSSYSDLESMQQFYQELEQGLADPVRAARRVSISAFIDQQQIHLRVTDQGTGHQAPEPVDRQDRPHGRGVLLMQSQATSVGFTDGGRTSDMAFALEGN